MAIPPASGAAAPEAKMVVEHTVYGPRLDQPVINKLAAAVASGMPSQVDFVTNWYGTRLRASSLALLRQAVDQCLQPGDSRRLNTLELSARSNGRLVRVTADDHKTKVTVDAEGTWAIGRDRQLCEILLHAGGSVRPRRGGEWHLLAIGVITSLVGIGGTIRAGLLVAEPRSIMLAAMYVTIVTAAAYLVGRWRVARNRTVIWVAGALPRRGWAGWGTSDRIAAVAVLVSLLGVVATLIA